MNQMKLRPETPYFMEFKRDDIVKDPKDDDPVKRKEEQDKKEKKNRAIILL